ncbi:MAG: MmcQ/YjbR family DNA-binding protein [Dehalococcoidia bacterium]|nr:MmcQ/YjbR family DNA-binding protein [Dehalococcoidia bacterium]
MDDPIERLREICLALTEATEKEAWGEPTFRIRDKIFAQVSNNHHDDRVAVWCKAPAGVQEMLVKGDPTRSFRPPYVGHKGWIGVYLDVEVDWDELADIVEESYRMTAPKRLLAERDAARAG